MRSSACRLSPNGNGLRVEAPPQSPPQAGGKRKGGAVGRGGMTGARMFATAARQAWAARVWSPSSRLASTGRATCTTWRAMCGNGAAPSGKIGTTTILRERTNGQTHTWRVVLSVFCAAVPSTVWLASCAACTASGLVPGTGAPTGVFAARVRLALVLYPEFRLLIPGC
jgi:hypothetical protein